MRIIAEVLVVLILITIWWYSIDYFVEKKNNKDNK